MKTIIILIVAAMAFLVLPSLAQEEPADKPAVEAPDTTNKQDDEQAPTETFEAAKDAIIKAIEKVFDEEGEVTEQEAEAENPTDAPPVPDPNAPKSSD